MEAAALEDHIKLRGSFTTEAPEEVIKAKKVENYNTAISNQASGWLAIPSFLLPNKLYKNRDQGWDKIHITARGIKTLYHMALMTRYSMRPSKLFLFSGVAKLCRSLEDSPVSKLFAMVIRISGWPQASVLSKEPSW